MIFLVGYTIYFIAFLLKSGAKVLDYFDSASVLMDYFVILSILPALFLFLFAHLDCKKNRHFFCRLFSSFRLHYLRFERLAF